VFDLAALTQLREQYEAWRNGAPMPIEALADLERLSDAASRLVSRLWQPCQTCDGDGQVERDVRHMETETWAVDVTCPSCGGVGVEPTPEAVEDVAERLWRQFLSVFDDLTAVHSRWEENIEIHERWRARAHEHLMALWRVANEETP